MNKEIKSEKPKFDHNFNFEQINSEFKNRIDRISSEFQGGFDFIKRHKASVTFFGSARTLETDRDYIKVRNLAKKISEELNYAIVTGGGPGMMEAANRGAHDVNGESLGLTIKLPMEQTTNPYLTDNFDFQYFFSRKVCMTYSAEAYIYCPGGFGTMDELFEILTLVQTEKIEKVPIILYGKKFWKGLDKFIKKTLLKTEKIDATDINLYTITDDIDEIIEIIRKAPIRTN